MTWLMEFGGKTWLSAFGGHFIYKKYLQEQLLIKQWVLNHLILLKIQHMTDIKEVLLQQFINVLIKTSGDVVKLCKSNYQYSKCSVIV